MSTGLSQQTFAKLLSALDPDRARAGARYEDLRRTLVRFFEWRGAPFPEDHADDTFDRVARRLDEGLDINNISGYCYNVARLILLETRKRSDARRMPVDAVTLTAPERDADADDRERRLACLDRCLRALPGDGRDMILEYYRLERRERIDARRAMAERLGIKVEALANRALRLRDKLADCVSQCVRQGSAT
jgi:DNA-directed RNA polymerase specialized sigma24 family protein